MNRESTNLLEDKHYFEQNLCIMYESKLDKIKIYKAELNKNKGDSIS
jgi:hypothetical protein